MDNLCYTIEKYVGRSLDFRKDVRIQNDSDDNGDYIKEWNITDIPQPTLQELQDYADKNNINNQVINSGIYKQLSDLDFQSISTRYQREFALNNPTLLHTVAFQKIQDVENQAIELRKLIQ